MRSFLDAVDLRAVRAAADSIGGPFGAVAACLGVGGVLQLDADDPTWPDRDRLFVGDAAAAAAVTPARPAPSLPAEDVGGAPGTVLGTALGAAIGSALDGGIFRVWCLLGPGAVEDGVVWEAARCAVAQRCGLVSAVLCGAVDPAAGMFAAAGWQVARIDPADPVAVLGAMDQAAVRTRVPTALVARTARA